MTSERLERFKEAQAWPGVGFESALAEITTDHKRGHWIWYVFPQLSGLGYSSMSRKYGITDIAEAEAYLEDPVLGARLLTITAAVAGRLKRDKHLSLETLMGSHIDALKLVSSLTLFASVAKRLHAATGSAAHDSFARTADEVLDVADSQGYPRCDDTLARMRR